METSTNTYTAGDKPATRYTANREEKSTEQTWLVVSLVSNKFPSIISGRLAKTGIFVNNHRIRFLIELSGILIGLPQ